MSNGIVFATGGTTRKARFVQHKWQDFDFVCQQASEKLLPVFEKYKVSKVANCMTAGGLWGGFIFVQEVSKHLNKICYPFSSNCDVGELTELVINDNIDTLVALPNFAVKLFIYCRNNQIKMDPIKTVFYFGEGFSEEDRKLIPSHISIKPMAYTTQETGVLGFHCPYSDEETYHIFDHVQASVSGSTGGLIVDVAFPSGAVLKGHETNDCVDILPPYECLCTHKGHSIKWKGREEHFSNIFGISISAEEIKNAYWQVNEETKGQIDDIQIISGFKNNQCYVDILVSCDPKFHSIQIDELARVNHLVKELYHDTELFNLQYVSHDRFEVHPVSGKMKFHIIKNVTF